MKANMEKYDKFKKITSIHLEIILKILGKLLQWKCQYGPDADFQCFSAH